MSRQIAWVTGGGTGIGLGIARSLADEGYAVYISGRRSDVLEREAAAYAADATTPADAAKPAAGVLIPAAADVSDDAAIAAVANRIREEHGGLDLLAMSAGVNVAHRSIEDTTPDEWRKLLDINATGSFLTLKAALPLLKGRSNPLVVNIASVAGIRALRMAGVAYAASKFALASLGVFGGAELAEAGIRMTTVHPGEVNTPILDQRAAPPPPEKRAQMVQPADIGALVVLIAKLPPTTHVAEMVVKPRYQEII